MTPTISPAVLDLSPLNTTKEKEIKILSLKQTLQRLPILLAQVKTGNTSDSILNEIRQTFYSLYEAKQILKKNIQ